MIYLSLVDYMFVSSSEFDRWLNLRPFQATHYFSLFSPSFSFSPSPSAACFSWYVYKQWNKQTMKFWLRLSLNKLILSNHSLTHFWCQHPTQVCTRPIIHAPSTPSHQAKDLCPSYPPPTRPSLHAPATPHPPGQALIPHRNTKPPGVKLMCAS